jgi:hypothetical protein
MNMLQTRKHGIAAAVIGANGLLELPIFLEMEFWSTYRKFSTAISGVHPSPSAVEFDFTPAAEFSG